MHDILFEYEMHPTTWVYISSLMTIGIYFKFHRLLSVRNLDLLGLIAFSPGLMLLAHGNDQLGYAWLFMIGGFFLIRLLLDPVMVRRPLLEPNLSASGMAFTLVALLVFLMTNLMAGTEEGVPQAGAALAEAPAAEAAPAGDQLPAEPDGNADEAPAEEPAKEEADSPPHDGPGYPPFALFAGYSQNTLVPADKDHPEQSRRVFLQVAAARTVAILAHIAVVIGMVLIGYRHFDNLETGVATATLYLLLPYTSEMTGYVDHVVPAALLVWAVLWYRRPIVAGIFLGLAAGLTFFPFFLLPLWCGFYWQRGLIRFLLGMAAAVLLLAVLLAFSPAELGPYGYQLRQMFGWLNPLNVRLAGFWQHHHQVFRMPVMAAFMLVAAGLALWPAQKNLGTLLSCSAAVMLGTQFWHAYHGGIYMAWYLPLLLLTVFRPNLEDRVAITALPESWVLWRKGRPATVESAA